MNVQLSKLSHNLQMFVWQRGRTQLVVVNDGLTSNSVREVIFPSTQRKINKNYLSTISNDEPRR